MFAFLGEDRSRTDEIFDISVLYDGSWSKRGFTSKICVGFVVDSYTSLIDFSVMFKFCRVCEYQFEGEKRRNA